MDDTTTEMAVATEGVTPVVTESVESEKVTVPVAPIVDVKEAEAEVETGTDTESDVDDAKLAALRAKLGQSVTEEALSIIESQRKRITALNKESETHRRNRRAAETRLVEAKEAQDKLAKALDEAGKDANNRVVSFQSIAAEAQKEALDRVAAATREVELAKSQTLKAEQEAQLAKLRADESDRLANVAKIDALRVKIGNRLGLPSILVERLSGTTEAEIMADAQAIKDGLPQPTIANDASVATGAKVAGGVDQIKEGKRKSSYRI